MHSLVLLPGLACDAGLWQGQLAPLASRHQVHVSDVHTREDSIEAMARTLLAEHPGQPVLAGCSMGGMVALAAAALAPQRVRALALFCTTARPDTAEQIRLRSDAIKLFEQGRLDDVLRPNIGLAFHPRRAADPALTAAYLEMIHRAGAAQLVRQNRAVMARPDLRPTLAFIRCPVLLVSGGADQLLAPESAPEISRGVGAPQLVRHEHWADCGHLPTLEEPDRVAALLLDWLAAVGTAMP